MVTFLHTHIQAHKSYLHGGFLDVNITDELLHFTTLLSPRLEHIERYCVGKRTTEESEQLTMDAVHADYSLLCWFFLCHSHRFRALGCFSGENLFRLIRVTSSHLLSFV